jgi:hypothetical protein
MFPDANALLVSSYRIGLRIGRLHQPVAIVDI